MRKGQQHTPEARAKIAAARKGKAHTPEARQKMREAHAKRRSAPVDVGTD